MAKACAYLMQLV